MQVAGVEESDAVVAEMLRNEPPLPYWIPQDETMRGSLRLAKPPVRRP